MLNFDVGFLDVIVWLMGHLYINSKSVECVGGTAETAGRWMNE